VALHDPQSCPHSFAPHWIPAHEPSHPPELLGPPLDPVDFGAASGVGAASAPLVPELESPPPSAGVEEVAPEHPIARTRRKIHPE
jgi:hypothetical protein